jgi:hypothetical protein
MNLHFVNKPVLVLMREFKITAQSTFIRSIRLTSVTMRTFSYTGVYNQITKGTIRLHVSVTYFSMMCVSCPVLKIVCFNVLYRNGNKPINGKAINKANSK